MLLPLLCILLQAQETVVIDGVTFSVDRKTLIDYPEDKVDEEYVVPEGTEVIARVAFSNQNLHKITLPLSLREVGCQAMSYCSQLTTVMWGIFPQRVSESLFDGCQFCLKPSSHIRINPCTNAASVTFMFL